MVSLSLLEMFTRPRVKVQSFLVPDNGDPCWSLSLKLEGITINRLVPKANVMNQPLQEVLQETFSLFQLYMSCVEFCKDKGTWTLHMIYLNHIYIYAHSYV